ncbi:hypothetical protein PV736_02165 [Streptomyces scabiei]|uniref:hypothetical protein n=1 Tax=Streptomyces scabiei TaxID=1930 RepID=UPI000765A331|nr:hypothetical protein [Streptomyces scabiei]MDX2657881.1 hypothetical protein [Streptomyces scabiei]MDX2724521.1 hypothetical protein [Streptomyces scabiei]MDX2869613.1 hypothetical protein [Streptomyces scabiei]MDX2887987.1 hypothetical protein [Streptomyces scabiei]MDX2891631.1 hypothetical protein [Streptomyces scabiei]
MHDLIRCIVAWLRQVFAPGTGRRRAGVRPAHQSPVRQLDAPRPAAARLPAHRSPYGLEAPLPGESAATVRPYVVEAERARQRRRRVALVLASDFGVDLDRHVIGAEAVTV